MQPHDTTNEIPYGYCHCGCGQKTWIATQNRRKYGWVKGEPIPYANGHRKRREPEDLFWVNLDRRGPNDCWEWKGYRNNHGYGMILAGNRRILAHRYSYQIHNGRDPKELWVLHRCDNPACCNPAHLFLGTPKQNTQDMVKKNRVSRPKGERSGSARFTNLQAQELRRQFSELAISVRRFAFMHGVGVETMRSLIRGITYQDE